MRLAVGAAFPWNNVATLAGIALVVIGLWLPASGLDEQTALHPVAPERLVAGENLFKYALVGHGLLFVACGILAGRTWTTRPTVSLISAVGPDTPAPRLPIWVLPAIVALALVLRLIGSGTGMWFDEVVTLTEFVRLPFAELVRNYADQNQHPLYSLMARASVVSFGETAFALRLPAIVFGVASIGLFFWFARSLCPAPEPLLGTLFLAVAYHHVWFSQNARGYTALLFWILLGSLAFVHNLREPSWGRSLAYAIAIALALYTHLTAAFFVAGHGLIYAFLVAHQVWSTGRFRAGALLPLAGFLLMTTLAFQFYALVLPQVVASFQEQVGSTRVAVWTSPLWGLLQVWRSLEIGFVGVVGGIAVATVVGAGLLSFARREPLVLALLVLPCFLGAGVMLYLNRHMYPRFFFPVFPLAIMVVVRGTLVVGQFLAKPLSVIAGGPRLANGLGVGLAATLIVLSAASLLLGYRQPKQDFAGALAYVEQLKHPDDPVVAVGLAVIPVTRYYGPEVVAVDSAAELAALQARHPERPIWLIYTFRDHMVSFHPDLLEVIDASFRPSQTFPGTVGGGAIVVCRREPLAATERVSSAPKTPAPDSDATR